VLHSPFGSNQGLQATPRRVEHPSVFLDLSIITNNIIDKSNPHAHKLNNMCFFCLS
jgi:hypothetical protein